jgi:hypothetical protein
MEAAVETSEQSAYVARFQRTAAVLLIAAGFGLVAGCWTLAQAGLFHGHRAVALGLFTLILAPITIGIGATRLIRGLTSDWVALAVDVNGIYFGAQAREEPRWFSWDEVSALVLFARRSEFVQGTVRCVGVRLHPCAPDSPETYLRDLARTRARSDLPARERAELDELRDFALEAAVSFHTEARGWWRRPSRLRAAMRAHVPGVPIIEARSESYYELVGWRAGRDRLREPAKSTETSPW